MITVAEVSRLQNGDWYVTDSNGRRHILSPSLYPRVGDTLTTDAQHRITSFRGQPCRTRMGRTTPL